MSNPSSKDADDWPELDRRLAKYPNENGREAKLGRLRYPWWRIGAHARPKSDDLGRPRSSGHQLWCSNPTIAICFIAQWVNVCTMLNVTAIARRAPFAVLQSRIHELWARFFSSTLEEGFATRRPIASELFRSLRILKPTRTLEAAGDAYHAFRAQLMIDRNEGLTKTYNRFHARGENCAPTSRVCARSTLKWMPPSCAHMAGTIWPIAPRPNSSSRTPMKAKHLRPASTGRLSSRTRSSPVYSPSTPSAPPLNGGRADCRCRRGGRRDRR